MDEIKELPKIYEPHDVEDRWIDFWQKGRFFAPRPSKTGKNFSIVIPPPNVTGSLHMGHALNSTIQDILARYHRMRGDQTLWVVGTDHAGIATQNVVERQLKEEGKTRHDLGREAFIKRVWQWRHESGGTIINQLKRLGASCDYEHERFTMDEGLSHAVKKVFVSLYDQGLLYRGERLINWCPRCHTALSDLEVEHGDQKGSLWHLRYLNEDKTQALIVATTRPETLFGDTALAVHPEDDRYKNWIGKKVWLPLTHKQIPVIADTYVDQTFGSGVVKITPAHDFNDFLVGERHQLPRINILTADGHLNENTGSYQGLSREQARNRVLEDLKKLELMDKEEPYQNRVGTCYRCKTVVEPYLTRQWFVKTKPLAEKSILAVKNKQTRFVPEHWEKTYFNWMENIQDWCVSRQIWWGHQIPAWYCPNASRGSLPQSQSQGVKPCPPLVAEEAPKHCPSCGSKDLVQDDDVLDTWFSSALWPFSTLGWPDTTQALKDFYPTSVLVTAFDIIFFWVARMMMMGLHFMKQIPFRDVHIHALVRDPMGQKMSKSKGNVVDPLLMMKKYGTDAFRFTLAAFAAQGRDIKLDEARIEGYRNFCNKIWNASRFALMNASVVTKKLIPYQELDPLLRVNQWIVAELNEALAKTSQAIEAYEFNTAAQTLYTFFWHSFCDWYLEFTKEIFKEGPPEHKLETAQTTLTVLDTSLRLLHPFMPFITEEIWQILAPRHDQSISCSEFPMERTLKDSFVQSTREMRLLIESITAIRSIRQETGVSFTEHLPLTVSAPQNLLALLNEIKPLLIKLARLKDIHFTQKDPTEPSAVAPLGEGLLSIPLAGLIDAEKEKSRLLKKKEKLQKELGPIQSKLKDPTFIQNAPAELVTEKNQQEARVLTELTLIERAIKMLGLPT